MVINLIFINKKSINTRQIYGKAHKQKQKMPIRRNEVEKWIFARQ